MWLWNPPRLLCTGLCNLFWINVDSCKQKAQEPHSEGQWQTFHQMWRPSAELAGRKINERRCSLTQSSCLTCETQNCFHCTTNCFKTIKTNKTLWYRTKCLSAPPPPSPHLTKKKIKLSVLLFQEACQLKLKWCINQAVISEIGHLFSENLSDAPQWFTRTSLVFLRRCVEQLFNIYNVWSANHLLVLWADNE